VGLDDISGMANHWAKTDPEYKDWLIKNPKLGLTQILDEESSKDPHDIGPPYTVFLLRPDGTVIDNSDDPKLTNYFIASDANTCQARAKGRGPIRYGVLIDVPFFFGACYRRRFGGAMRSARQMLTVLRVNSRGNGWGI
jgi:hypothetical protein